MKNKYLHAYMDMAVRFGQTSEATRRKVGALIVGPEGGVRAEGTNGQPPGWPTEACEDENNVTLPTVRHAEIAALEKLWSSPSTSQGCYMFISAAPCKNCAIKIKTAGISRVYYRDEYSSQDGIDYLKKYGVIVEKLEEMS